MQNAYKNSPYDESENFTDRIKKLILRIIAIINRKGKLMRLLAINLKGCEKKSCCVDAFINAVTELKPDIIAIQNVLQSLDEKPLFIANGYYECDKAAVIRADNFILNAVKQIGLNGFDYYWSYQPVRRKERKERGNGIMSLSRIADIKGVTVSRAEDKNSNRVRKILGIKNERCNEWFYSVSFGKWNDKHDPFFDQWTNTLNAIGNEKVFLSGEFNNPANLRNQGYDLMLKSGFYIFPTSPVNEYILTNEQITAKFCTEVFNNENYGKISDYSGIMLEY